MARFNVDGDKLWLIYGYYGDDSNFVGQGSAPLDVLFPGGDGYRSLIEGAWVIYRDGTYFLFYSGDRCCSREPRYAVMVARSKSAERAASPQSRQSRDAAGPRIGIVTNAGGPGILAADACVQLGLDVPALPDLLRASGYYAGICRRNFHLDGPPANARKVFDNFQMIYRATDLGRIKSVATIPATPSARSAAAGAAPSGAPAKVATPGMRCRAKRRLKAVSKGSP